MDEIPTKTVFPHHPVIIGVDMGSPDGDKCVACVEYKEFHRLLDENEQMLEVCKILVKSSQKETGAYCLSELADAREKARAILQKRKA